MNGDSGAKQAAAKIMQERIYVAPVWTYSDNVSKKSRLIAFLFALFLGGLGVHRFYVGKVATGLLWLFTLGFLGFGVIIDCVIILLGGFRDGDGKMIIQW